MTVQKEDSLTQLFPVPFYLFHVMSWPRLLGVLEFTDDAVVVVIAYLGVLELANDAVAMVFDGALSIVIHPAGATQYVVDARGRLVPCVSVFPPAKHKHKHVIPSFLLQSYPIYSPRFDDAIKCFGVQYNMLCKTIINCLRKTDVNKKQSHNITRYQWTRGGAGVGRMRHTWVETRTPLRPVGPPSIYPKTSSWFGYLQQHGIVKWFRQTYRISTSQHMIVKWVRQTNVTVITTRIRRMMGGYIFTLCVSPHLDGGTGWVPPPTPPTPPPPNRAQIPGRGGAGGTPYWNSIPCACYTAGGMPLAFT